MVPSASGSSNTRMVRERVSFGRFGIVACHDYGCIGGHVLGFPLPALTRNENGAGRSPFVSGVEDGQQFAYTVLVRVEGAVCLIDEDGPLARVEHPGEARRR